MEQTDSALRCAYDYAGCARVWQRVSPELEPYPPEAYQKSGETGGSEERMETLPGAIADPCCMGTQAAVSLEVLRGFVRAELSDRHTYLLLGRGAPTMEARRLFRALSEDEARHARRLLGVLYLITGTCERITVQHEPLPSEGFCPLLRRLYHEEACGAFNYRRAAEEAQDVCLRAIFAALADDEQRHADSILALLERALRL